MLFLSGFIMTDHNHVRRGCHYHVRRGYVRLYESWFDSMSRWFDHELPQPRPTWLWLPRPFPPGSSSARRSSSAIHIHGGAGGDYPVCGCEQEYATLRTSRNENLHFAHFINKTSTFTRRWVKKEHDKCQVLSLFKYRNISPQPAHRSDSLCPLSLSLLRG